MRIHFINDMERNTWKPKLGLGYLSSFIKKYLPGTETTISFPEDDIIKNIETIKPDLIGLTSTSTTYKKISELSFYLKEKFPDVPQIMGGPHLSLLPEDLPVSVDLGVSCEGEETLLEVLRFFAKENKMPQGEINGTIYRKNGQILLAPSRKPIENLDTIPHPDLDLLQVEKRKPEWGSLYVMTSRGCPYRCSFCASIKLWSRIRYFSVEYVVEELEILVEKYRQKMIVIYDDLFIMNKKRIAAIGDLIRKKGLHKKVEFECNGRVDVLDEEVARELRRMNVTQISFGMESGSEQILKYLKNKTITLDQVRKAVKIAKNAGIEVGGTFMIGTPGETEEDIRKTIDFIRELDLDFVSSTITTPFPKTQLWDDAKRMGLLKQDRWDDNLDVFRGITLENMNQKTIVSEIKKETIIKFYDELTRIAELLENRRLWRRFIRNFPDFRWMITFLRNNWRTPLKMVSKIFSKVLSESRLSRT